MIKLMIAARTTPDRPRADALAHLKTVHGPMVYDAPPDAGPMPSAYVQNHVVADFAPPVALAGWSGERDLVTEIWFDDIAHLRASTQTPYYLANLKPDESRFVDQASVRAVPTHEDRDGPDAGDTAVKLFVFLKRGGEAEAFDAAWAQARRHVRAHRTADAASRPLSPPGGPAPWIDGVWSLWFADRAEAERFAAGALVEALAGLQDHVDPAGGYLVLADEYPVGRLRRETGAATAM